MTHPGRESNRAGLFRRVGLIAVAVVAMLWVVVWLRPNPPANEDFFRRVSTVPDREVRAPVAAAYMLARGRFEDVVLEPEARAPIASELGPFLDLVSGRAAVPMGEPSPHVVVLDRKQRRARRAYEGAPPFIPHPLDPETERTQDCAPCHEFGGYNPVLRTYAPRTPHPEWTSCMQCHVRPVTTGEYVASDWSYQTWPSYGSGGAVVGAPPAIPHTLQLRENCLACHGGVAAAPDIRTSHPERFNCRQCHVPAEVGGTFSRPVTQEVGG